MHLDERFLQFVTAIEVPTQENLKKGHVLLFCIDNNGYIMVSEP